MSVFVTRKDIQCKVCGKQIASALFFVWWHKVNKTFWRIKPKKGKTLIDGEEVQARKCKVLHIISFENLLLGRSCIISLFNVIPLLEFDATGKLFSCFLMRISSALHEVLSWCLRCAWCFSSSRFSYKNFHAKVLDSDDIMNSRNLLRIKEIVFTSLKQCSIV